MQSAQRHVVTILLFLVAGIVCSELVPEEVFLGHTRCGAPVGVPFAARQFGSQLSVDMDRDIPDARLGTLLFLPTRRDFVESGIIFPRRIRERRSLTFDVGDQTLTGPAVDVWREPIIVWLASQESSLAEQVLLPDVDRMHVFWPGVIGNGVMFAIIFGAIAALVKWMNRLQTRSYRRWQVHRARRYRLVCRHCTYDLRAQAPGARCPECGRFNSLRHRTERESLPETHHVVRRHESRMIADPDAAHLKITDAVGFAALYPSYKSRATADAVSPTDPGTAA